MYKCRFSEGLQGFKKLRSGRISVGKSFLFDSRKLQMQDIWDKLKRFSPKSVYEKKLCIEIDKGKEKDFQNEICFYTLSGAIS